MSARCMCTRMDSHVLACTRKELAGPGRRRLTTRHPWWVHTVLGLGSVLRYPAATVTLASSNSVHVQIGRYLHLFLLSK